MNLTKCFVAGLCLSAMTASAGFVVSNAFEATDSGTGWTFGDKTWSTVGVRVDNDAVNGRASYTGNRPMPGSDNNIVLKLDTEGGIWTNTVGASFSGEDVVYADMLVKFVPSEELPTLTDGKLAIAIKAGLDGTNYLNIANNDSSTFAWAETAQAIDTSAWYRVTVKMYFESDWTFGQVYVNGTAVGSPLALDGDTTLNSIGFQGTGYVDEVAVRDDDPIATAVLISLSFSTGIQSVYVGETAKNTGDTVATGSDLIITAAQWKEIASVSGTDVTVDWVAGAAGDSIATVKVSAVTSGKIATITAQTETSTAATSGSGTSFDGAPMNKVASWALLYGVTSLSNGIYDNYLFNIDDAATVPTMNITSITVSGSTVTVTVTAGSTDFTAINGTLKLLSYATLDATPTTHTITFSGTTTATITHDIGTDKFVKALVE